MRVMLDTNIALDVLLKRSDFFEASYDILKLSATDKVSAFISASAITDIYYVTRKNSKDNMIAKNAIERLTQLVQIADVLSNDVALALIRNMVDFEDALVATVANRMKIDYIITRNIKDFAESPVHAILPQDFLNQFFRIISDPVDKTPCR